MATSSGILTSPLLALVLVLGHCFTKAAGEADTASLSSRVLDRNVEDYTRMDVAEWKLRRRSLQDEGDILLNARFMNLCFDSDLRFQMLFAFSDYEDEYDSIWCGCSPTQFALSCYFLKDAETTCTNSSFTSCSCPTDNCDVLHELFYFDALSQLLTQKAKCNTCLSSTTCDEHRRFCTLVDFDDIAHEAVACSIVETFDDNDDDTNSTTDASQETCNTCKLCTIMAPASGAILPSNQLTDGLLYDCFDSLVTSKGLCDTSDSSLVHNFVAPGGTLPPEMVPSRDDFEGHFEEACNNDPKDVLFDDKQSKEYLSVDFIYGNDPVPSCDCLPEAYRINCRLQNPNTGFYQEQGFRFSVQSGNLFHKETCEIHQTGGEERCVDVRFDEYRGIPTTCEIQRIETMNNGLVERQICTDCQPCQPPGKENKDFWGIQYDCFGGSWTTNGGCEMDYGYAVYPLTSPYEERRSRGNGDGFTWHGWSIAIIVLASLAMAVLLGTYIRVVQRDRRRREAQEERRRRRQQQQQGGNDDATVLSDLDLQEEQDFVATNGNSADDPEIVLVDAAPTSSTTNNDGIMT